MAAKWYFEDFFFLLTSETELPWTGSLPMCILPFMSFLFVPWAHFTIVYFSSPGTAL